MSNGRPQFNLMHISTVTEMMDRLVGLANAGETDQPDFKSIWNDLLGQNKEALLVIRDQNRVIDLADQTVTWLKDYETLSAREFREKWGTLADKSQAQTIDHFLGELRNYRGQD